MALIKDRKEKPNSSGTYDRIFNNRKLGKLITKIQATSIANGTELEAIILAKAKNMVVNNILQFEQILKRQLPNKEIFIIPKKIVKKSSVSNKKEPDFLIIQKENDILNIIEIKDGWVFDTKKSAGEYQQLKDFQNEISKVISYKTKIFMCSFNNNNKEEIFNGFKKKYL